MREYIYENKEYYNQCIMNYNKLYNINTDINTDITNNIITLKYLNEINENIEYNSEIEKIINNLKNVKKKQDIPNVRELYQINDLNLEDLYKIIIPYFEKIYNSYLKVIDNKIKKHFVGKHPKLGAFKWHYDNHPNLIINIMIYLNDVNKDDGGFEFITIKNKIIKFNFSQPSGNKDMESFINKNYDKIKINQVTGNKGTLFYFDNNIIHRASPNVNKERTVLLIQLYPSLHKIY